MQIFGLCNQLLQLSVKDRDQFSILILSEFKQIKQLLFLMKSSMISWKTEEK